MAQILHGPHDERVLAFKAALEDYEASQPEADASIYRQTPGTVRIRILDPRFEGMTRHDRHYEIWEFLTKRVDRELMGEISILLPLAPSEQEHSSVNREFEHPAGTLV